MKMEEGLAGPDVLEIGQEIAPGDAGEHCTASNLQAQPCAEQYPLGLIYQRGFQTLSKESQAFPEVWEGTHATRMFPYRPIWTKA